MKVALTDRFVAATTPGSYFDARVPGLQLRVSDSTRSWNFNYSRADGRRTQFKIGSYPAISLAAARALALEARGLVDQGQDPQAAFGSRTTGAMTVAALVDVYLSHPGKVRLRTHAELSRRLHKNVVPLLGGIPLGQLHRRDVRRCTDAVQARGAEIEASRVFEDVRAMLRWAVARGDLEANPIEVMSKPAGSKPRTRTLDAEEIHTLWTGLPKTLARSKTCQRIIKLCLVTGQRVGEVSGMAVAEVNFDTKQWRIPGERTKNQHEHTVPLTDAALEIIGEAVRDAAGSPFVFPIGDGDRAFDPQAVARTILRAQDRFGIASWSAHDLRRTALNGMAALGVAPHVIGHAANHRSVTRATVTTQHYVTHSYQAEVRAALELWADRLDGIITGSPTAEIIAIGRAR